MCGVGENDGAFDEFGKNWGAKLCIFQYVMTIIWSLRS